MENGDVIDASNKKRIAQLVRLLSSSHEGEVLAATRALSKICSFNDLGNLIEAGEPKLSKAEMQQLYDAGYQDGHHVGLEKGKRMSTYNNNNNQIFFESQEPQSELAKKAAYCYAKIDKIVKIPERRFIEDMIVRTTGTRPLSPAQANWLNSIYHRLGGP